MPDVTACSSRTEASTVPTGSAAQSSRTRGRCISPSTSAPVCRASSTAPRRTFMRAIVPQRAGTAYGIGAWRSADRHGRRAGLLGVHRLGDAHGLVDERLDDLRLGHGLDDLALDEDLAL